MGVKTGISWCDHTASPWHGCTHGIYIDADGNEHEHPGCLNCYAEKMSVRNPAVLGVWGELGKRVVSASFHDNCKRWNAAAEKVGERQSVFPSICDPFEAWEGAMLNSKGERYWFYPPNKGFNVDQPYKSEPPINTRWATMADFRSLLFWCVDYCKNLDFLLLTKRPQNILTMWEGYSHGASSPFKPTSFEQGSPTPKFRQNVFLLTSISDQATTDALVPHLLECAKLVPVIGVSAEPLLGSIDLPLCFHSSDDPNQFDHSECAPIPRWVIIGCESKGQKVGRLPNDSEKGYWDAAKDLVEQCRSAGIACWHKQGPINGKVSHDPAEWPEWARVQEFPALVPKSS